MSQIFLGVNQQRVCMGCQMLTKELGDAHAKLAAGVDPNLERWRQQLAAAAPQKDIGRSQWTVLPELETESSKQARGAADSHNEILRLLGLAPMQEPVRETAAAKARTKAEIMRALSPAPA
jgi:hypothetical protein